MEPQATADHARAVKLVSDLRECVANGGAWCVKLYDDDARMLLDRLAVAERERDQARQALGAILHWEEPWPMDAADIVDEFQDIARAALAGDKP